MICPLLLFYRNTDCSEAVMMRNIKMCTDAVNTNVIEHTAFIRASAAQNNLNLEVYRDQVRNELKSSQEKKETAKDGNCAQSYCKPIKRSKKFIMSFCA